MFKRMLRLGLALTLLAVCLGACAPKQAANTPTAQPTPSGDVTSVALTFVQALSSGDYAAAAALCEPKMKSAFPPVKMQETWQTLLTQMGTFRKLGDTRYEKATSYDYVYVACEFEKGVLDAKVVLDQDKMVSGLWFAPHQATTGYQTPSYVQTDAFSEQEILVGTGDSALPGTLSTPSGNGPFPGVVLVHGSGPNDRDETVGANKPFRDLAWGLASQGIAVLRYDKRTLAHPEQMQALTNTLTVKEEAIDDAVAAAALLRQTPGIDPKRVFVLGHSLGGTLAPRIATLDTQLAGLIILAGATRPLEDLMLIQTTYLSNLDGSISAEEQTTLDTLAQQVQRVKDSNLSVASEPQGLLGAPVSYWLDLRDYHPAATAAQLSTPMLILQGDRDYQVTTDDLEGWKQTLSGHSNVEFKLYPGLNHLFITGEGPSTPTEYETPGHVSETVIRDIAAWIRLR